MVNNELSETDQNYGEGESSQALASPLQRVNWEEAQDSLKQKLVMVDDFPWKLPTLNASLEPAVDGKRPDLSVAQTKEVLRYVGGVDMSYCKEDSSLACAALVILDLQTLQVVHEEYSIVKLDVPYLPGFLAFREAPILLKVLEKVKQSATHFYPQLLMVDGNGLLHPRGFGLACHLGVSADCPAVGIGKNLHHVDGLTLSSVKQLLEDKGDFADTIHLTGCSGRIWGVAMRSSPGSTKPIFVSIGHRISLETAVAIVRMTCKYRIPEPIRQADIRSRDFLQKHGIVRITSESSLWEQMQKKTSKSLA